MTDYAAPKPPTPLLPAEAKAIRRALRAVPRRSPLRPIAEQILAGLTPGPEAAVALIDAINPGARHGPRERLLAAWCLGSVPLDDRQRSLAAGALAHILDDRPERSVGCIAAAGCLCAYPAIVWLLWACIADAAKNRHRAAAAATLGRLGLPESLGPLWSALTQREDRLTAGDWAVRVAAAASLATVARTVPGGGLGDVPRKAIKGVCRMLYNADDATRRHLLTGLELFGDSAAIPDIAGCLSRIVDPATVEQANRTLDALRRRAQNESDRARLLRPASAPGTQADMLLRPVEDAGPTDPDLLLRPSEAPDEQSASQGTP